MASQNDGMLRPARRDDAQDIVERAVLAHGADHPGGTPSRTEKLSASTASSRVTGGAA